MKKYLPLYFVLFFLTSCSNYKNVAYFQDIQESIQGQFEKPEIIDILKIKVEDELSIIVSAEDPQVAASFNLPTVTSSVSSAYASDAKVGQYINQSQSIQTYIVDTNGDIGFPVLGKIRVEGLTKDELVAYLDKRLREYIKDPIINAQIVNFKVSVIGEVTLPGTYGYKTQQVTILDAIASAQDLTIHGERTNVLVIRRDNNGQNKYHRIDLTTTDMFSSPNYYLQQNDIVYVLPNKEKRKDANTGQDKQFTLSVITSSISYIISVIAILIR